MILAVPYALAIFGAVLMLSVVLFTRLVTRIIGTIIIWHIQLYRYVRRTRQEGVSCFQITNLCNDVSRLKHQVLMQGYMSPGQVQWYWALHRLHTTYTGKKKHLLKQPPRYILRKQIPEDLSLLAKYLPESAEVHQLN